MTNKPATPPIHIQSTHSINGITTGNDLESAQRIKNATIAIHAVIENHCLNDFETDVVLKLIFPQIKG